MKQGLTIFLIDKKQEDDKVRLNFKERNMKKIMVVSDRVRDFKYFIDALNSKYEVFITPYIEGAENKLKIERFDLVVVEVSMSPLEIFTLEETEFGKITGIVWYQQFLKNFDFSVLFWCWSFNEEKEVYVKNLKIEFPSKKIYFLERGTDQNHLFECIKNILH